MTCGDRPIPVRWFVLALMLVAAAARADDPPEAGVKRLTDQQLTRLAQEVKPRQVEALKLFKEGKAAEAIPIVEKYLLTQREVLLAASSNAPEPPPKPSPIDSRFRSNIPSFYEPPRTTWNAFRLEIADSLDLLAHLHETLGDFTKSLKLAKGVEEITANSWGLDNWRTRVRHQGTERLRQLAAFDADQLRVIDAGKKATALLANSETALGTAFCIDPRGLFLTDARCLAGQSSISRTSVDYEARSSQVASTRTITSEQQLPLTVLLNLGTTNVKILPAKVLRVGKTSGLALLKVQTNTPLPSLDLAFGIGVEPGQRATVLGLPAVPPGKSGQPAPIPIVEPLPARVVSIRKQRNRPWIDQLDVTPSLGYSGGPVLDDSGRVIGAIVTGLGYTDVHYVVPIDRSDDLIGASVAVLDPPGVNYDARKSQVDWMVQVYSKEPPGPSTTVEVLVGRSRRRFLAEPKGKTSFLARVVPVGPEETDRVELSFELKPKPPNEARDKRTINLGGKEIALGEVTPNQQMMTGRVQTITSQPHQINYAYEAKARPVSEVFDDRTLKIGGVGVRLGELSRIEFGPSPRAFTADGRRLSGPIDGLEDLRANGEKGVEAMNAAGVEAISLRSPPESIDPVETEVVVKQGDKVVDRHVRLVPVVERAVRVEGTLDLSRIGPLGSSRSIHPPAIDLSHARVDREPEQALAEMTYSLNQAHHYSAAFSDDGLQFASGGDVNRIRIYGSDSTRAVQEITQDSWVQSVGFTPDGRRLLSAEFHKRMHLWDLSTRKDVDQFEDGSELGLEQCVLSPDGLLVLAAYEGGKRLLLWELETGKKLRDLPEASQLWGFAFSPDSRQILIASPAGTGYDLRLVDARSGQVIWSVPVSSGNAKLIRCWCPPGSVEAVVAFQDGTVERRDRLDGKPTHPPIRVLAMRDGSASLSPDGRWLLTGHDDKTVRYWDLETAGERRRFSLPTIPTGPPAFSPDGRSAIGHSFRNSLHVWSLSEPGAEGPAIERRPSGKFDDVIVAGGGRYLLLVLKDARRLAIFDANAAAIIKEIELASADVLVAAGAEKGILAYPGLRFLERLDLASLEVDRTAHLPFKGLLRSITMGSDAAGPIVASWKYSIEGDLLTAPAVAFIDPDTLKIVRHKGDLGSGRTIERINLLDGWDRTKNTLMDEPPHFRTSAGGNRLVYGQPPTVALELEGGFARLRSLNGPPSLAVTSPDGRSVSAGPDQLEPGDKAGTLPKIPLSDPRAFPTSDPAFHLAVDGFSPQSNRPQTVVRVCSTVSNRVLFAINGLQEMNSPSPVGWPQGTITPERRYHLIPAAKLLVTIPHGNDRLVLRKLDMAETLERITPDDPVVTSPPLVTARPWVAFRHRIEARSRRGDLSFDLIEGPEGMTLSDQGELAWEIPVGQAGLDVIARVRVSDSADRSMLHTVRIVVRR